MPSNEGSAHTQQSPDEPTDSATEANSTNPPRRRNMVSHFAAWARLIVGVVLAVSVIAVVFFAGFFTERDYGDVFSLVVSGEDTCIQTSCQPAGRYGQHCRQYVVPC